MNNITPLKRFGQNYLQDQNIIKKIVDEINPLPDDFIVEIGPGQGSLTDKLSEKNKNITAIEIDKRVIENLKTKFPGMKLVEGDILDLNFKNLFQNSDDKIRIVGNIPYNITSPILFKLFENNYLIKDAVFMVQYEVAKRMVADLGSKDYGIISVLLNYYGKPKLIFKVSPNVFYPRPKVNSAVVHIYFNSERNDTHFNSTFISIVKSAFGNRRKTLRNSFGNSIFAKVDFSKSGIDLSLRAEQLNVENFMQLTNFVNNLKPY